MVSWLGEAKPVVDDLIVRVLKLRDELSLSTASRSGDASETSEVCEECEDKNASVWCEVCRDKFCDECAQSTHSSKRLRQHPLVPLEKRSEPLPKV